MPVSCQHHTSHSEGLPGEPGASAQSMPPSVGMGAPGEETEKGQSCGTGSRRPQRREEEGGTKGSQPAGGRALALLIQQGQGSQTASPPE